MGISRRLAALTLCALAACGGRGGTGSSSSGGHAGSSYGVVNLVTHSPLDGANQVPLDAAITLDFDANVLSQSFAYPDTWLRETDTGHDVSLNIGDSSNGRISLQPASELKPETHYTFQLSALTTDINGRILDTTRTFAFRTFDATPPTLIGINVPQNATGVSRTQQITITFDEEIAQSCINDQTLFLSDSFGTRYACDSTSVGEDVVMTPYVDLPGARQFSIIVTSAIEDRVGNRLATPFQSHFTTEDDSDQPSMTGVWPAANSSNVSPRVQPTFTFNESMDPATVEAASLLFQDQFGNIVPFGVEATREQRKLRIRPTVALVSDRTYSVAFMLGGAAATDLSGNPLRTTQPLSFTTGLDDDAPQIVSSSPTDGDTRVPSALIAEVKLDKQMDPDWINDETVHLMVDDQPWSAVVELVDGDKVRVTPILDLPTDTGCRLRLRGGQDGLHDLSGNVLVETEIAFTTSSDSEQPGALFVPPDGTAFVAVSSNISVVFDAPMDPATLNRETILFTDDSGTPLLGDLTIGCGDRAVTFTPSEVLHNGAYYRVRILGGNSGPRRVTGNWFDRDHESRFQTTGTADGIAPSVSVTINDLPEARRDGLVLPPFGWTLDVDASDAMGQWVDVGSIELQLDGGLSPPPATMLANADISNGSINIEIPEAAALPAGAWTLSVTLRDLSGNVAQSNVINFEIEPMSGGVMPFERTQVVWVRTDLDRDRNGRADFADDMLRLGLAAEGDPNGSNAWLQQVMFDGIVAKANAMYKRGPRGQLQGSGSVPIRLTAFEPISLAHMQIAVGGLDPEGDHSREYGDASSGVLGRAFYDYRNGNISERNTGNSPGTGVFPAEMFLYQARIHQQIYPSFQTVFASRFLPLCPDMGGTPAGSHHLDDEVLTPTFDYAAASGAQRARWNTVMNAMDDWASVIGIILAHEIGHSVGLVAPGDMPFGLFGDSSLHNTYAGAAEVMAPSVGYEAMTSLNYKFRDIDLAYLRQRILLR